MPEELVGVHAARKTGGILFRAPSGARCRVVSHVRAPERTRELEITQPRLSKPIRAARGYFTAALSPRHAPGTLRKFRQARSRRLEKSPTAGL